MLSTKLEIRNQAPILPKKASNPDSFPYVANPMVRKKTGRERSVEVIHATKTLAILDDMLYSIIISLILIDSRSIGLFSGTYLTNIIRDQSYIFIVYIISYDLKE